MATGLTKGIYIVAAKRTPFGRFGGSFANKSITDLTEVAAKAALAGANIDPKNVDSVIVGNVNSNSSPDGIFAARHVLLRCGIPTERPALSINRLCGSGFQAIVNGAHDILVGGANIVLTGGAESMSGVPFAIRDVRFGTKLGQQIKLEDGLWGKDTHCDMNMGETAEKLGAMYNVTREESDNFAFQSQQKWKAAHDDNRFKQEISPVTIIVKKKPVEVSVDEHPRPQTTLEALAKLPAVFKKNGLVTAGNASGVNDGAGVVVLASEEALKQFNLTPLARLVGYSVAGVDPSIMGIGPVPAIQMLYKTTGMRQKDIDLFEINEAFASQTLACQKALDLDPTKLNVNGGAVALGHPVGASGARITGHMAYELKRRNQKLAVVSACIGGGQGIALLIENV